MVYDGLREPNITINSFKSSLLAYSASGLLFMPTLYNVEISDLETLG